MTTPRRGASGIPRASRGGCYSAEGSVEPRGGRPAPRARRRWITKTPQWPGDRPGSGRRLPVWGWGGLLALGAAHLLLALRVEPVATYFYEAVWWAYILAADGLLHARRGWSPLASLRWGYLALAGWSLAFWLLFEAYNFRLDNWHYVGVPSGFWAVRLRAALAFSTVLPAVFTTALLIESVPAVASARRPRLGPVGRLAPWLVAAGAVAMALPLLVPRYAFPLVWIGLSLLLDPWNRARGAPSLLADLEAGRPARLLALLASGAICGLLWEAWNYRAGTKWVYTVPFAGALKLFEMPLLGFLGFPPFALEGFAAYQALVRSGWAPPLRWLSGGPAPSAARAPAPAWRPRSLPLALVAALLLAACALAILEGIEHRTVRSFRAPAEGAATSAPPPR